VCSRPPSAAGVTRQWPSGTESWWPRPPAALVLSEKAPRPRPSTAMGAKWVTKDCQDRPKFQRLRRARGGRWLRGGRRPALGGGAPGWVWHVIVAALRVYITRIERGPTRPRAWCPSCLTRPRTAPLPHWGGSIRPRGGPRPAYPLSTGALRAAVTRPSPLCKK
jgi:hypothetical protein